MADNETLDIEVDDDQLLVDIGDQIDKLKADEAAGKAPEKPEAKPSADEPEVTTEDVVAEIKRQLEEEKRLRQEHERRAQEAELRRQQVEQAAHSQIADARLNQLNASLRAYTGFADQQKAAYVEAMRNGDYEAAAAAQEQIAKAADAIATMERGKSELERMVREPAQQPQYQPPPRQPTEDDLLARVSPKSADWLRAHPEFLRDTAKRQMLIGAHNIAEARGIALDSDEYFATLEDLTGLRKVETKAPPAQRSKPVVSAPAAREAYVPGGGQRVTLTADEVAFCKEMDMDPKDYAREKLKLQKERA